MRSLAFVFAFVMSTVIHAQTTIPIVNHSFELPAAAPNQFIGAINAAPFGWSVYNTTTSNTSRYFGVFNPNTTQLYYQPVPDGSNIGVVFLTNTTNLAEAGLQQTLSTTLQANSQYTLQVEVGNMAYDPQPPQNEFNFTGFPGYRIDLMAGNTVLASDNNTLSPAEGFFQTSTVNFATGNNHANLNQQLAIRLVNLNGPGIEVNFDNIRLSVVTTPVPEPGCLLVIGMMGGVGFLLKRTVCENQVGG